MKRIGRMKGRMLIILAAILFLPVVNPGILMKRKNLPSKLIKKHITLRCTQIQRAVLYRNKSWNGSRSGIRCQGPGKYTGTFTDGTYSIREPLHLILVWAGNKRLDEGIGYMKKGGTAILIVPSDLAYGPDGYSDIPGYTPLIFTVELLISSRDWSPGRHIRFNTIRQFPDQIFIFPGLMR